MSNITAGAICLTVLVMLVIVSLIRIEIIQEGIRKRLTEIEKILKSKDSL